MEGTCQTCLPDSSFCYSGYGAFCCGGRVARPLVCVFVRGWGDVAACLCGHKRQGGRSLAAPARSADGSSRAQANAPTANASPACPTAIKQTTSAPSTRIAATVCALAAPVPLLLLLLLLLLLPLPSTLPPLLPLPSVPLPPLPLPLLPLLLDSVPNAARLVLRRATHAFLPPSPTPTPKHALAGSCISGLCRQCAPDGEPCMHPWRCCNGARSRALERGSGAGECRATKAPGGARW